MCSTLAYPRCTQVSHGVYQTDCGSTPWAFSMFIAWNLLSMVRACMTTPISPMVDRFLNLRQYIFVNMFTGVVVESFSYVFQSTSGGLKSITRHETRAFKKAWAEFSDPNTRLLERPNLVPFLAVRCPRIALVITQLTVACRNSVASLKSVYIHPTIPRRPS